MPTDSVDDWTNDAEVYTYSTDNGAMWVRPAMYFETRPRDVVLPTGFPTTCLPLKGYVEMNAPFDVDLTEGAGGIVHVLYSHDYFEYAGGQGCGVSACPDLPFTCFRDLGYEVFHKILGNGEPAEWSPPNTSPAYRLSDYGDSVGACLHETNCVGVYDAYGTLHGFWMNSATAVGAACATPAVLDSVQIFHAAFAGAGWTAPDTVVSFSTADTAGIGGFDVVEQNGIFHVVVDGPNTPSIKQTTYFRGILGPETPETIPQCDSSSTCPGSRCWSGSVVLCQDYVVAECETLTIAAGTSVSILYPDIEIVVRGKLIADGKLAPIRIGPYSGYGPERAQIGFWKGIRLCGGSARALLINVSISGAVNAIRDVPGCPGSTAAASCALADTVLPPGVLRIENCRFAFNEVSGVFAKGNSATDTPDLVQVINSEFYTNLKGLVLENVSAPDTGGFAVRGNRFLYNDYVGVEIRGKFGRTVFVDSNLVQGLGADEFIESLPDSPYVDRGIWYDEYMNGSTQGDLIVITKNTLYRTEDAGLHLDMLGELIPGDGKTKLQAGNTLSLTGNFFHRVGTGVHVNEPTSEVKLRSNVLLHYGTGVRTSHSKVYLGGAGSANHGRNYFDNCYSDSTSPPFFTDRHIVAMDTMNPNVGPDSLYAHGNYWCPVDTLPGQSLCNTTSYFLVQPLAMRECLNGQAFPAGYPTAQDFWDVMSMPLKTSPSSGSPSGGSLPNHFALHPNQPNPFNPRTLIRLDLPRAVGRARVTVYDTQGRVVALLVDGPLGAGRQEVIWSGRNQQGESVASGIYFCRFEGGGFHDVRKMTLVK